MQYELWRTLKGFQRMGYVYLLVAGVVLAGSVILPHYATVSVEYESE